MYRIDYEIKLNETGRPCIDLPQDYEHRPEDRFFAIELARYILQDVYGRRSAEFDGEASKSIENGIALLGQVGDEIAGILWNDMKSMGEIDIMFDKKYYFSVNTIEDLNKLGEYIITSDKIYKRGEGLKVLVTSNSTIYEFKNNEWGEADDKTGGSSEKNGGE